MTKQELTSCRRWPTHKSDMLVVNKHRLCEKEVNASNLSYSPCDRRSQALISTN